jgi:hypothetical protein
MEKSEEQKIEENQIDTGNNNQDSGSDVDENEEMEDDFTNNENLLCRLYRKALPEENDYVAVKVTAIDENGAYVNLLEYNDMQAFILSS